MGFLSSLFRRKGDSATAPAVRDAAANDQPVGDSPARVERAPRVREYAQLPPYETVLTSDTGVLPLPATLQREMALLSLDKTSAAVIATERVFGSAQHMTLVARATRAGIHVTQGFIVDDSAILALIYEKARRNVSNKQDDALSKAESVQLFESIIADAIRRRATDVHFLLRDETSTVIFRIDGLLRKYREYPTYMLNEAAGVAYTKLAEESSRSHPSYNARFPQSCSVVLQNIAERSLNLRYQSIPAVGGADIILRLLFTDDADKKSPSLEQLGYAPSQQKLLELAARKTVGAIFVAGVTSSGKSTTLKTLMTMNPDRHLWKQFSVEDPAEYVLPGITQVSVQRKADAVTEGASANPFVAAMRTILRGDPDEIMVGEVRDSETGSLLKTMVQSGHQVYTTVHAISAIEVVERMTSEEIGLSRQTMASRNFVSALVYQRLLPKNCEHCALPAQGTLPENYLRLIERKFGLSRKTLKVAAPEGCSHCEGTGVKGQTVVAEIIAPDSALLKLLREGRDIEAEELWRSRRTAAFNQPDCEGKTAFEHGLYKVSLGVIDPRTLEDAFEPFESYQLYQLKEAA